MPVSWSRQLVARVTAEIWVQSQASLWAWWWTKW